mgnify:CR=1 FL=1
MPEIVIRDGKEYIKREYSIDHGKDGCTTVTVYDPCISEESQQKRRDALVKTCLSLIKRGLA